MSGFEHRFLRSLSAGLLSAIELPFSSSRVFELAFLARPKEIESRLNMRSPGFNADLNL